MKLGVIGYGNRISGMVEQVKHYAPESEVTAIVDVRKNILREERPQLADATWYDTPEEMVASAGLDGVLIGTRCSLHTEMALKVLPSRIPLFLEKPVSTNMKDLLRLKQGYETYPTPTVVSFPLRVTSIVKFVKELIDSGKIGTVEHVQAVNNVPYGGVYFHDWYRDENETGGLFLQKATHDFDYINAVLGMKPVSLCAMTSKQIFKGTKPAGLKCVDCAENRECAESSAFRTDVPDSWQYCCFAEDTGNEDSGSVIVRYESGMHVNYSQNFFVRRGAAARGARFMGYKGTIEFDFYSPQIKVHLHHTPRVETYDIDPGEAHFGGDSELAANFAEIIRKGVPSISSLEDGLLSALMCLKAKQSAETGTFQQIDWN